MSPDLFSSLAKGLASIGLFLLSGAALGAVFKMGKKDEKIENLTEKLGLLTTQIGNLALELREGIEEIRRALSKHSREIAVIQTKLQMRRASDQDETDT